MNISDSLSDHVRVLEIHKKALNKLGIKTVRNLLYRFPTRYGDPSETKAIADLSVGDSAVLFGTFSGLKTLKAFRKKIPMAEARFSDSTGTIKAVWFHQPYIAKMIPNNVPVRIEGKVSERRDELYISNPKVERLSAIPDVAGDSLFGKDSDDAHLYPIYPESRGLTSNWIYHAIQKIFKSGLLEQIKDPIPAEILGKYHLPPLKTALVWIHTPKKQSDALAARKRFAFEEVFFIQLLKQQEKRLWKEHGAFVIEKKIDDLENFISNFPFPLTKSQQTAIEMILADFKRDHPMSRLLEGDVGSGKTAVAAAAVQAVYTTRPSGQSFGSLQTAYMVPTEILAQQHFESFIKYFKGSGISIGLITSSGCRKFPSKVNPSGWTDISRSQLLKWLANGEIPVLIGTHSLIQKTVNFKHLAYVIIDEQHRFGTKQRQALREKHGTIPHLLSMTATPIPRTLALTIYGDLDLTILDEMPPGRKPIITEIVLPEERNATYEKIRKEIESGRQVFVICPRIDLPDPTKELALNVKSVKEEAKRLKEEVFPEFEVGILHGKMKPKEKESVMLDFKAGKMDILVATSVVEVGVNVPNATIIVIEGAERFGLAQLHQLRGRVMRSTYQPYCYIFSETKSGNSVARLRALKKAANGFELAEYDLAQRGAGELSGGKQWGISDIGMEAIRNIKMVEAARQEAATIVEKGAGLESFPLLKEIAEKTEDRIHFE
jgi:ATP-dependent DNA helicase RecG